MPPFPNFVGSTYVSQSPIADGEELINWYVEHVESRGAKSPMVFYPTPGAVAFSTAPTQIGGRAMFEMDGLAFTVIGPTFYEVFSDGTVTSRGTLAVDANPATISSNGDGGGQLFITSGDVGYCYDLTSHVLTTEITSGCTMGGMLDGYFLALDAATSTVKVSDLLDGTTWDPTQYFQRSAQPDPWRAMIVADQQIWLFGGQTSEVWYNAGTSPLPFALNRSSGMQYGIAGTGFSAANVGGAIMWVSENKDGGRQLLMTQGYLATPVSTRAIEWQLSRLTSVNDGEALVYQDQGHTHYCLNFLAADVTICYDATEQEWHKRGTWVVADNQYHVWRAQSHCYAFGKHLVADRLSNTIYQISVTLGTEIGGGPLRRLRRAPSLFNQNLPMPVNDFQVLCEAGLGLSSGQGSDPQMMLRISPNGGKTFWSERSRSVGALGNYGKRAIWTRCGTAPMWTPEISVTDPIPWRIHGALYNELGAA